MQTTTPQYIAVQPLLWLQQDGTELRLVARVGTPYAIDERTWACPCELEGHAGRLPDIFGGGSMQALCLAARLVRSQLADLIGKGERLVDIEGGDAWDLERLDAVFGHGFGAPPASTP